MTNVATRPMYSVSNPTARQANVIKRHNLIPCVYVVFADLPDELVVIHRISGVIKNLKKEG